MPELALVHSADPDMTPGRYLRLRRTSQRVAAMLVGLAIAPRGEIARAVRYADAEEDRILLDERELRAARELFAFDVDVYLRLAQGLPLTALCRACGCSWLDPCEDAAHGPCAWVPGDPTLCTACRREGRG